MPSRALLVLALILLPFAASSGGCIDSGACTEIGCSSSAEVSFGSLVVDEPYTLSIDPNGATVTAICLGEPGDEPQPPEWLSCDANGFTITGSEADLLTVVSVTVVPVSTGEAVITNELVNLSTDEILRPNGPDCEPTCYTRSGVVPEPPPP
ncbi:hypothetical protein ACNOYE_27730 [Nannocystaceae bacterium ST9]